MAENTVSQLKDYFSTTEKPVSAKEMMDFWSSLTLEEKEYYKTANLAN